MKRILRVLICMLIVTMLIIPNTYVHAQQTWEAVGVYSSSFSYDFDAQNYVYYISPTGTSSYSAISVGGYNLGCRPNHAYSTVFIPDTVMGSNSVSLTGGISSATLYRHPKSPSAAWENLGGVSSYNFDPDNYIYRVTHTGSSNYSTVTVGAVSIGTRPSYNTSYVIPYSVIGNSSITPTSGSSTLYRIRLNTPPSVTVNTASGGWYNGNLTLSILVSDIDNNAINVSVAEGGDMLYSNTLTGTSTPQTVTPIIDISGMTDGSKTLTVSASDGTDTTTVNWSMNLDRSDPTIALAPSTGAWISGDVAITPTLDGTGSAILTKKWAAGNQDEAFFTGGGGNALGASFMVSLNGTYTVYASDQAGNDTVQTITISNIDKALPTVTSDESDPAWRATPISVYLTYDGTGSPLTASQYKLTGDTNIPGAWDENGGAVSISADGTWYLHYRATDAAGNVTTGYFGPYNIDTTAPADPTLTRSPDQDASKDPYTVSLTHGADPLSGVAGSYYRLTGATTQDWALWPGDITISADGATTIEAYTRDNVGHDSGTVSISVNVYGQALAAATAAVETAETTKTSADLNTARQLVVALPAGAPEKGALTARLDLVEQYIMISQGLSDLNAALDTAEADTTSDNVEACQTLITSLQALITALPDGAVKTDYQAQLDLQILRYNAVYDRLQKILELTMNLNAADLDVASDPARLQLADLISAGTAYSSTVTDLADNSQLISAGSTGAINVPGTAQGHTYRVNIDGLIDGATVAQRTFDKQQPDTVPPTFTYGYTLGGVLYMGANDNHQLHAAPYAFRTIGDGEDISALQNFVPDGSGFAVTAWTMGDEGELALNWQAPATNPLGATPATVIVYVRDYSLNRADLGFTITSANQILFGDAYIPQAVKDQIAAANKPSGVTTSDYTVPNALSPTTQTEIRGSLQDGSLTIETGAGEINSGEASLVIDLKKDLDALNSIIRTELGTTGNTFYRISISEKDTGRLVYSNFVFDAAKIVIPDLQDSTLYTIRIAVVHDAQVLAFRDIERLTADRTAPVIERILVQGNTLTVIARDNLQLNALPYQFVQSGSIFASSDWLLDVGQLMAANFGVSSWTNDPTRQVRPGESLRILVRDAQDNYTVMDITAQPEIRIDIINADTPYVAGAGTHTNLRDLLLQILQAAGKTGVSPDNYTLSLSDPSMVAIDGQQLLFKAPGTCYLILTSKIDGSVIKYQIKIGEKIPFDRKVVVQINSEIDLAKAFEKVLVREFGEGAVVGFAVKPGDEEKGLLYDGSIYKAGSAEAIVTVYAGTAARVVPLYLLVVQDEYPASEVEAFRINLPFVIKVGDSVALEDITRAISGLAETQCSKWTIYETESDAVAITGARIEALREGIALVRAVDLANGTVTELTLQIIGFADAGTAYGDTAAHWAQQPVAAAAAKGLLRGYEDGTYRPDNDTTREEFLAVLTRVKALERTAPMAERRAVDLKLTHSGWSYYLVSEALNGLTAAEIEQVFGKNANLQAAITREEAAALIASVLDLSTGTAAYTDTTGSNKADAIGAVTQATLMIGYGDGRFGGANSVTRGEMAQIALNLLGNQQLIAKLAN